jgi:hypothetical protein
MFFNGKLDISFFDNFLHVSLVADKIRPETSVGRLRLKNRTGSFFYTDLNGAGGHEKLPILGYSEKIIKVFFKKLSKLFVKLKILPTFASLFKSRYLSSVGRATD